MKRKVTITLEEHEAIDLACICKYADKENISPFAYEADCVDGLLQSLKSIGKQLLKQGYNDPAFMIKETARLLKKGGNL